jgi:hypothetical protein
VGTLSVVLFIDQLLGFGDLGILLVRACVRDAVVLLEEDFNDIVSEVVLHVFLIGLSLLRLHRDVGAMRLGVVV